LPDTQKQEIEKTFESVNNKNV